MSGDLLQSQFHVEALLRIDFRSIASGRYIGLGLRELVQKSQLEPGGVFQEKLLSQLDDARGIGDDLHGFNA